MKFQGVGVCVAAALAVSGILSVDAMARDQVRVIASSSAAVYFDAVREHVARAGLPKPEIEDVATGHPMA
ncbi:MAG: hypothetical protein ACKVOI_11895 [Dongiaceae bacterium]